MLGILGLLLLLPALPASADESTDRTAYFRSVVIPAEESAGDVVCILCSVEVHGTTTGDVVSIGGNITVDGAVTGDAVAVGGTVRLLPTARVLGEAVAIAGHVDRATGAVVEGEVDQLPYLFFPGQIRPAPQGVLVFAGALLGVNLLIFFVLPARFADRLAEGLEEHPLRVTIGGILLLAAFLLAISMSGEGQVAAILVPILGGLFLVALLFGYFGVCWSMGRRTGAVKRRVITFLRGAIVLGILMMIPYLGLAVFFAVLVLAPGIIVDLPFGKKPGGTSSGITAGA